MTLPITTRWYRAAGGLRLSGREAGADDAPLVFCLHGFPETARAWRHVMPTLARTFRVVALDQRGYNESDRPRSVTAYDLDELARDVTAVADELGYSRFAVIGHDWGASVGWWLAQHAAARLTHFAALCAPHPLVWLQAMAQDSAQRERSRYVRLIRLRFLPELLVRASRYRGLERIFQELSTFTDEDLAAHRSAWSRPGALTAMFNWYRALLRRSATLPPPQSIATRTLMLWGDLDPYAVPELADASAALCAKAEVVHLPDAGHWIHHEGRKWLADRLWAFLTQVS